MSIHDEINCPYCGGKTKKYLSGKDWNRHVTNEIFQLNRCEACDLIFLVNSPENISKYYDSSYHVLPKNSKELEKLSQRDLYKKDLVKRFIGEGNILEIGPSIGLFGYIMKKSGFCIDAIEMDEECVDYLNKVVGINAIHSDKPASYLMESSKKYNAICLWHSLEHMPKPWVLLDILMKKLNKGGYLFIGVPNPKSKQAKLMGKYWPHHDLPRHMVGLSMQWLSSYMSQHKMEIKLMTTNDEGSVQLNLSGWQMLHHSLSNGKNKVVRKVYLTLGETLQKILNPIEKIDGNGAAYVAVFKRKK